MNNTIDTTVVAATLIGFAADLRRCATEGLSGRQADALAALERIEAAELALADALIAATGALDGFDGVSDALHHLVVALVPSVRELAAAVDGGRFDICRSCEMAGGNRSVIG